MQKPYPSSARFDRPFSFRRALGWLQCDAAAAAADSPPPTAAGDQVPTSAAQPADQPAMTTAVEAPAPAMDAVTITQAIAAAAVEPAVAETPVQAEATPTPTAPARAHRDSDTGCAHGNADGSEAGCDPADRQAYPQTDSSGRAVHRCAYAHPFTCATDAHPGQTHGHA